MEDCHVGADTFVLPRVALEAAAAAATVPDTRAFYAVSCCSFGPTITVIFL